MSYRLRYDERVQAQFESIRVWFDAERGPGVGAEVITDLAQHCRRLSDFPNRGTPRDDISPGLRTISHRRRFTIGYRVDGDVVTILGIAGRGQSLDALTSD